MAFGHSTRSINPSSFCISTFDIPNHEHYPPCPKPLNIGMIGCGFMGRAHSNAYLPGEPLLPARAQARAQGLLRRPEEKDKLEKFAKAWGYESMELDWQEADRPARTST